MSSLRNAYGRITDSRKFPIQRPFTDNGALNDNLTGLALHEAALNGFFQFNAA